MLVVRGSLELEVAAGELVALVGEGSGELLRALAGVDLLREGTSAAIDGFDLATEREAARRRVGLVDGEANGDVFAHALSHGLGRDVAERRSIYLLQSLDVRGPSWRLALALALVNEPRVLLAKEPPAEDWPLLERLVVDSQLAVLVAVRTSAPSTLARETPFSTHAYPCPGPARALHA